MQHPTIEKYLALSLFTSFDGYYITAECDLTEILSDHIRAAILLFFALPLLLPYQASL